MLELILIRIITDITQRRIEHIKSGFPLSAFDIDFDEWELSIRKQYWNHFSNFSTDEEKKSILVALFFINVWVLSFIILEIFDLTQITL